MPKFIYRVVEIYSVDAEDRKRADIDLQYALEGEFSDSANVIMTNVMCLDVSGSNQDEVWDDTAQKWLSVR